MSTSNPLPAENWSRMLDALPDLICILDAQHKVLSMNAAMARRLGITPGEGVGLSCCDVLHGTAILQAFCPHFHSHQGCQEHSGEVREERLGGDFLVTCTPMADKDGQPNGSVLVARDITERKAAEAKNRRTAETLERRIEELAAFNAFCRSVNANLSQEQVASAALEGVLQNVEADLAFLFLREGDRLVPIKVVPESGRELLGVIPEHRVGECLCGLAVRGRTPLFSLDILQDPRCTWEECKMAGIRSLATLPLLGADDEVLGVIGVAAATERNFEPQGSFLVTLAAQVSIALVNARLHEALKRELIERRQTEQALRKSEEHFHSLFLAMQEGFALHEVICDTAGKPIDYRYLDVNPAFERATGIPRERWVGHTVREVLPNIEEHWIEGFGAVALSGQPATFESYVRDLDRYYQVVAYSPKHGQFAVIALNLTERRRIEQALEQERNLYKDLVASQPSGVYRLRVKEQKPWGESEWVGKVESNFTLEMVSERFCEILGVTREQCEINASVVVDAIHCDDRSDFVARNVEAIESLETFKWEGRLRVGDKVTWVYFASVPRNLPDGDVLWTGILLDITETRQAEQQLQRQTVLFENLFKNSPEAIAVLDHEDRVLEINHSFESLFGYRQGDARGHEINDLLAPEPYRGDAENVSEQVIGNGQVVVKEAIRCHRDGRPVDVSLVGYPLVVAGQKIGAYAIYRDIGEQKRALQELHRAHQTLLTVLDGIDATVYVSDMESYEILFMNKYIIDVFGADSTGRLCYQAFRGLNHPCGHCTNDRLLDAQGQATGVCTWESLNPITKRWYINYDRAIRWIDGRMVKLQIATDITERKRSEEERESLRRTAEELAGVFLGLGPEPRHNMDRIVRAACDLTGSAAALYNRLDDSGRSLEVWSGHNLPPDMPRAEAPRGHICYEATILGRDRTIVLGNLEDTDFGRTDPSVDRYGLKAYLGHPVHLRGAAIGALAIVDDKPRTFTPGEIGAMQMLAKALSLEEERHLVEQELKQSEERFRGMLQNVATVAVQGYSLDGTVRYWNQASESLYGYTAEEALGQNLLDLIIPPAMRGEVRAAIRHMAESGEIIPAAELNLMRKDGSSIAVYSSHALVKVPLKEPELFCIDIDLTERQRAEAEKDRLQEQLTQAQKMESVGRLAGGVAHDFNNMLGVIIGHAELTLGNLASDDPLRAALVEIHKAAQRSADLTRQLLAFARKQTVVPKILDLNATVEHSLKMLRRLIGEDIDLAWLPGNDLAPIYIDSTQIDQILTNLCVNARDAIAGNGRITIETAGVTLDREYCDRHAGLTPGNYVMLAVSDNGCGMDADVLSHVFEPFFTTKGVGEGTGLGLATVYGAVTQNNGFVVVYSEPQYGTTFKIYLPQVQARQPAASELRQSPTSVGGNETILLVEDEPAILHMIAQMLGRMGYTVIAAGTPGAAIRLAQESQVAIDLIMTDVIMPEMNGRDLARTLMSIYPSIRRLFMSGYTANVIAHHGVLEKGMHFIQKPFSMKDLGLKLREVLEG